jgi:hypothetical protein
MMTDKFNDNKFSPETEAVVDLHSDYKESFELPHSKVKDMSPATPEKWKENFSTMMIQMKRCIAKWECSGQGEGGNIEPGDDEEQEEGSAPLVVDEFGSLTKQSKVALDSRESFFFGHQPYLLYFWHMLNKHNLLGSSLNRLDNSVTATNGGMGALLYGAVCTRPGDVHLYILPQH